MHLVAQFLLASSWREVATMYRSPWTALSTLIFLLGVSSTALADTVDVGGTHTCAIVQDGSVKCWGSNLFGQLGDGKFNSAANFTPVTVKLDAPVMSIATGAGHSCALTTQGTVACWGRNDNGQLGNGNTVDAAQPQMVKGLSGAMYPVAGAKYLAAGGLHSCVVLNGGKVKCWGANTNGQLGNGTAVSSTVPVEVSSLSNVSQVALGSSFSCAVLINGDVQCWGSNEFGQLGNGTKVPKQAPGKILNLGGKKAFTITAGSDHACVRLTDNAVKCWGWNGHYQQGEKITSGYNLLPTDIKSLGNVSGIAAGGDFTCAIANDKTIKCLGGNNWGQLGMGAFGSMGGTATPQTVANVTGAFAINAGPGSACALTTGNLLKCWGGGKAGQLGVDPKTLQACGNGYLCSPTPVTVPIVFQAQAKTTQDFSKLMAIPWYQSYRKNIPASSTAIPPQRFPAAGSSSRGDGSQGSGSGGGTPGSGSGSGGSAPSSENGSKQGSPQVLYEYIEKNYSKFQDLYYQLLASMDDANKAYELLRKQAGEALEPKINEILKSNKLVQSSGTSQLMSSKTEYDKAVQKEKDVFKQLTNIFIGIWKLETGTKGFDATSNVYYQSAVNIYFAALFTLAINKPLGSFGECKDDIVKDNLMFQYAGSYFSDAKMNKKALGNLVSHIYCLPKRQANLVDQAIGTAYAIEMKIIKQLSPAYVNATENNLLTMLSPLLIALNDKNRFQGKDVPSVKLLNLYTERLNKADIFAKDYVKNWPNNLLLYNAESKKVEELSFCTAEIEKQLYKATNNPAYLTSKFESLLPKAAEGEGAKTPHNILSSQIQVLCSGGGWNEPVVWYQDGADKGCVVYKNFINVAANPVMKGYGLCSMWDNDRLGKMCCILPKAKKTSKIDGDTATKSNRIVKIIKGLIVSVAYADEGGGSGCMDCDCDFLPMCKGYTWKLTQVCTDDAGSSKKKCFDGISYDVEFYCKGNGADNEGKPIDICGEAAKSFNKKLSECQAGISFCYAECGKAKGLACIPPLPGKPVCGNGKIEIGETCDDGNTLSYDGCSSDCKKKDKPGKKWCEQCFYPKFQNDECKFYVQLKQEYADNPDCSNPYSVMDKDGCPIFKKGASCVYALVHAKKSCDDARRPCIMECFNKEGPPPPAMTGPLTEDEQKACIAAKPPVVPTWLNNFGTDTVKDVTAYGKNIIDFKTGGDGILIKAWWPIVEQLEKETGLNFHPNDVGNALDYARKILDESSEGKEENYTGKDFKNVLAWYDHEGEVIFWNYTKLGELFPEGAAEIGAHEAVHAGLDRLLSLAYDRLEDQLLMSLEPICTPGEYDSLDHWLMDILTTTVPGFTIKSTGGMVDGKAKYKSAQCPYFLEGK